MVKKKVVKRSRSRASDHDERAIAVLKSFRVIYGSVRQYFREVEKQCGVSGSQLWILQEVKQHPGIGVSDLADKLAIHQSTGSQLVEKLVRKRHLEKVRLTEDQRRVGLTLTRTGKQVVASAPGPAQGLLPEALGELSSATLDSLHRSLTAVIRHLDLKSDDAAARHLSDIS